MSELNNENIISSWYDQTTIHYISVIRSIKMKLLPILIPSTALLVSFTIIEASLDLSTVDLHNFKFFKYPQTQSGRIIYNKYQPFNIFDPIDKFNRAKAMFKYFADVLFGKSKYKQEMAVFFHPETASKLRPYFQQKFGYRGERLIAALGSVYNKYDSVRYDAPSSSDQ